MEIVITRPHIAATFEKRWLSSARTSPGGLPTAATPIALIRQRTRSSIAQPYTGAAINAIFGAMTLSSADYQRKPRPKFIREHARFGCKSKRGIKQAVSKVIRGPVLPEENGFYDNQWGFKPSTSLADLPVVDFEGLSYRVDWKPSTIESFHKLPDHAQGEVDCKSWWIRRELWR